MLKVALGLVSLELPWKAMENGKFLKVYNASAVPVSSPDNLLLLCTLPACSVFRIRSPNWIVFFKWCVMMCTVFAALSYHRPWDPGCPNCLSVPPTEYWPENAQEHVPPPHITDHGTPAAPTAYPCPQLNIDLIMPRSMCRPLISQTMGSTLPQLIIPAPNWILTW
jgi:hypothetical protein